MKYLLSFFAFLLLFQLHAQEKNEQEKRIKKKDVPAAVMSWFKDAYEKERKVKWFFQTDGEKQVFEAKLKHEGKKHSVEIKPNGDVVNIEIGIEFNEIKPEAKQNIESYLSSNYNTFKIKKIQIQYTGSNEDLEDLIDEDEMVDDININYEIEFYGKNEEENELWESLFNANGKLVLRRKIKLKLTDNLDY